MNAIRTINDWFHTSIHKDNRDFTLEVVKTLGLGLTGLGLLFTIWEGLENRRLAQEQLITERFTKAVEQLKEENGATVRIGGIYALERIAKDSKKDYWTIMDVLTSYVREKYPYPVPETEESAENSSRIGLQAVLTVIGRRDNPPPEQRDLDFSSLIDSATENVKNFFAFKKHRSDDKRQEREHKGLPYFINLTATDLQEANFHDANLKEANFYDANLKKADFFNTNLEKADLREADLRGATLFHADLREADLVGADLRGADLLNADLRRADLKGANLNNANLNNSYRELDLQQILSACFWDRALYKSEWDSTTRAYVPIKSENKKYIQELKEDLKNYKDEKDESVDCSRWE